MLEVQPHIDQVIAACRTLSPAEEPWTQIFSRPSVPNTATGSRRVSSVSLCTCIRTL
jgi:hypothetical protein